MKNILSIAGILIILVLMNCQTNIRTWDISSPDGRIHFQLIHEKISDSTSTLTYNVTIKTESGEKKLIDNSPLGIVRKDGVFTDQLSFVEESATAEVEDSYEMISGKQKSISSHGVEKSVIFENNQNKKLVIDFSAFNDGVAFRYRFPEEDTLERTVIGEITSFNMAMDGKKWIQPYDTVTKYTPAYETYFRNGIPIGTKAPGKEGWSFPALFEMDGSWVLLTESDLQDNFYGAHLEPDAPDGKYMIRLPEPEEALNTGPVVPTHSLPWTLPWRVILIGEKLNTIVESNLVNHLATPSVVKEISWIKPGRASWSWWSDHDSPQDYNELIPFIDLAADMGWEHSLVDANWNIMKNGDLEKVIEYAGRKDIGILVWYNSGGPHNTVGEQLRDAMHTSKRRREEFEKLHNWGVKGVKVDFFQSDKPHIIKQYHDILRDAEDYQIMCNFHGSTIPRGWRRTYPHLVSMEAVRGAECYSFDTRFPEAAPWYNTILPFTRNAIGPMDYTPVTFSDQTYPHITSYGHELALSIVFESGIIHYADRVDAYRSAPGFVKDFLKNVPASWDNTRFLQGYPGKYCIIARQKDEIWYIGAINGQDTGQTVTLTLPFLTGGEHMLELINDGDDERSFRYSKKPLKPGNSIEVTMEPNGGFVITAMLLE